MDTNQIISIRAFSRIAGVSDTAIRKRIENETISQQCLTTNPTNGRPELFLHLAVSDYENSTGKKISQKKIDKFLESLNPKQKPKKESEKKKEEPKKVEPKPEQKKTDKEIKVSEPVVKEKKPAKEKPAKLLNAEPEVIPKVEPRIPEEVKYLDVNLEEKTNLSIGRPEAERRTAIFNAETKRLELMEKRGELVSKKKVYSELYDLGQELKTNILSIPDKVIDNILASENRHEAHSILLAALNDAINSLENIENA